MPGLVWRDDGAAQRLTSEAELDELLDAIEVESRRAKPLIAQLVMPDGRSLAIGLGRDEAPLSSTGPAGMPPYFASDSGRSDETPVVYYYGGEWTEQPAWQLVPVDVARDALRHFYRTGELTPAINWREV